MFEFNVMLSRLNFSVKCVVCVGFLRKAVRSDRKYKKARIA